MWEQENNEMIRSMALTEIRQRSMEIPEQMLIEILIRLPVKSLMKFKSVSKFWLALISSRYFTNRFFKNGTSHQRIFAYLVDKRNLNNYAWFTSSLSSGASLALFNQDLTMPRMEGEFYNAVRGLACFGAETRLKICNVYTRQVVELPPISYHNGWSCITYNNLRDEYKVIRLAWVYNNETKAMEHENKVLEFGPGASWRDVQCHIPHRACRSDSQGICINGVLYYEASTDDAKKWMLMSFDLTSEEFNVIELPDNIMDTSLSTLINYNGEIAFLDYFNVIKDNIIDLWVIDGADKSRMNKKMTFVLPRVGFLEGGWPLCYRTPHHPVPILNLDRLDDVKMGGTGRNGELWLRRECPDENRPRQVLIYNLEKNQITHRIETRPIGDAWSGSSRRSNWLLGTFWDDIENIMHLEI